MGFSRLFLILLSYFFPINLCSAANPFFQVGFVNIGNFSTESTCGTKLDRLFSQLTSDEVFNYGFYNMSIGQSSDQVNTIGLSRANKREDACSNCLNDMVSELQQRCPNYKEAIGWSEFCTLHYSSQEIFGVMETNPFRPLSSRGNASDVTAFQPDLEFLVEEFKQLCGRWRPSSQVCGRQHDGPDVLGNIMH
ncbi:hypothetical protein SLE2022_014980 [Rubroshorea leprosula]